MKRLKYIAPIAVLALCASSISWAGGSSCTHDGASASTTTTTGGSCTMKGTSATAAGQVCAVKSNQVIYSFSVPTAHCGNCASAIQTAAMDTKGIACAGIDLSTHTAYIIADKGVSKKEVSKMIAEAGFKNKYTGEGPKVETAFTQAVATGGKNVSCCTKSNKEKA